MREGVWERGRGRKVNRKTVWRVDRKGEGVDRKAGWTVEREVGDMEGVNR